MIFDKIVADQADPLALRDEADILWDAPLLAYLAPGRYCPIDHSLQLGLEITVVKLNRC